MFGAPQMSRLPDFIIIGAMKSATTTLYRQLADQPGISMSAIKEPNFFSDDAQYARGIEWYKEQFAGAPEASLAGEASTHYTKRPDYPLTVDRMSQHIAKPRLIYVMRHPIDRLISQYIHQWSERQIQVSLTEAIRRHPELVHYSKYHYQLEPYLQQFGSSSILPVFYEAIVENGQRELERVCEFIGYRRRPAWLQAQSRQNISSERIRRFPGYDAIMNSNLGTKFRRSLVPQSVRTLLKNRLVMKERPKMNSELVDELENIFNRDLEKLKPWLGRHISCAEFYQTGNST